MCPCQPLDDANIHPPPLPPDFIGNFIPQLPDLEIPFPAIPIEDLLDLFNKLSMILPPGVLKPHLSPGFSKNPLDAILSLLEKFMPFLMMYTFFLPILNLILCIIEVLCALTNPFKLIRALIRLFRNCIPEFLALFPFLAIPIMILSLLLLILALILYLIERIIGFIKKIIANIRLLSKAVAQLNNDGIVAITKKLGDLLCIFQNLFVLFGVILLIIQIIQAILRLTFKIPPCDDSDGSDDGCCTPDVCPSFIKNNKEIALSTGSLQYFNNVGTDSGLTLPPGFPKISSSIRNESWQFYDATLGQELAFNNITHAFDLPPDLSKVFFPAGVVYDGTTEPSQVPYTVDLRLFYDPAVFGRTTTDDPKGPRFIRIRDCIVITPPVDGVSNFENTNIAPFNGTLSLAGGSAFEDDNKTGMLVKITDTVQGNLNTIVHLDPEISATPILLPTDGVLFSNVEYTFKINHAALIVPYPLITIGCHPDVSLNKNFINATIGALHNGNADALGAIANAPPGFGGLPDMNEAQNCILNAVNTFKQSVSIASAAQLQATATACLTKLRDDTSSAIQAVIRASFDQFKSDFTLDPTIQFTTRPIKVSVLLADTNGLNMATGIPVDAGDSLAQDISADITLGKLNGFIYDGYSTFLADITSLEPGNGTIKVAFQNKVISILNNPTDITINPSVTEKILSYTFVQSTALPNEAGEPRRDEGDVSRDGSDGNGG